MKKKIVTFLALVIVLSVNAQEKKWTLQECVEYALSNNISIKQQELVSELVKEDITTAEGNFYPSLNASLSHRYNFGSYIDISGSRVSRDSRSNGAGISTGATLYNGKRNKNLLIQAEKNLEAAGFDLEENKNNIMLFVVNSFLNVLLNKESLKIAEDQVAISISQVEKAKGLVEAGSQPKSILLEAEAALANDEQQITSAQNAIDLSLLSLAQLLQLSHRGFDIDDVHISINSASLILNDTDAVFDKAVNSLPEIKSAEIAVENSNLAVEISKSAYYPTLSFSGGIGTSYQHNQGQKDVRPLIDPNNPDNIIFVPNGFGRQFEDNLGFNLGFSLSIPIFNRFQTKSNVNRSEINAKRSALQLLDEKIKLRESIERAYADAKASLNEFISAEKSLSAQEEAFRNAQESYNLGVMTSFDFDQVRGRLVNAQSAMVNAKYNFVFRSKLLEYYYGIPIVIE